MLAGTSKSNVRAYLIANLIAPLRASRIERCSFGKDYRRGVLYFASSARHDGIAHSAARQPTALRRKDLAAPYVHPRLAAVAHRHTNLDGSPVRPVVNVFIHGAAPETPRFAETVPSISDKRH
jgi:hypothetical protein